MPADTLTRALLDTVREAVRAELEPLRSALLDREPASRSGSSDDDPLLTIDEVCDRLRISKTTLWQLRRQGKIEGRNVGRRVVFRESDVNALLAEGPRS